MTQADLVRALRRQYARLRASASLAGSAQRTRSQYAHASDGRRHAEGGKAVGLAPYLVENVRRYLQKTYGYEGLYQGGMQAYTTIDPRLQRRAEEAVRKGLRELDKRRGYRGPLGRLSKEERRLYRS